MGQNDYTFDLRIFYDVLRKRLAWLLILTVLMGVLAGLFTALFIDKTYSSTVQFYVNSSGTSGEDNPGGDVINSDKISTAKKLVTTCTVIIGSNSFLEQVSEQSGLGLKPSDISKMLTQSAVSDTEILRVKVSHTDPKVAYKIANTITELAPVRFTEIVPAGTLNPFDYARIDTVADSPNIVRNVVIAMILAFFLLYAIFLIAELTDTTIRDEEDLKKVSSYPFLGEVPRISTETEEKGKTAAKEA